MKLLSKKFIFIISLPVFFVATFGCVKAFPIKNEKKDSLKTLSIAALIDRSYRAAQKEMRINKIKTDILPEYLQRILKDGKITIGLGVGTEDLGKIHLLEDDSKLYHSSVYVIAGKPVIIEARLILTKDEFKRALNECEIVFVSSHSRYGAGPVFMKDGKANPYRMQKTAQYLIVMPESEVCGYKGRLIDIKQGPLHKKYYYIFAPDSNDLDRAVPYPGYQMLVLSTCSSKRHFFDEIKQFRKGLPTTAIFTTRACCMDTEFRIFMRLLYEVFLASSIHDIVRAMNEQYVSVAWEHVKKGAPNWNVINNLYVIGINK